MNFFIKTGYNIIFTLILLVCSVFFSYLAYRKSNIINPQKLILRILRFFSIFIILFLFLSPFVYLTNIINEKPLNIVFVDNSASLNIEDRQQNLLTYIRKNIKNYFSDDFDNRIFTFSSGITQELKSNEIDSIRFDGINKNETNISLALQDVVTKFNGRTIASVNFISDGIINSGGSPVNTAKLTGAVFNYYLIGDTVQKKDLVLESVYFNKYAYIESSSPVKAVINSYGYNKQIKVKLFEENSEIDSKIIGTTYGENNYTVDFSISSATETIKKYKIEIESEPDEITKLNNSEEFIVKFLSNKLKVLFLAGGPSADNAYLSQEIRKINNFDAKFLTQKSANEFYEGSLDNLNDYQLFILSGFPTSVTGTDVLVNLKEKLSIKNSAVFFIASKNTDYSKLSFIDEYLPFTALSKNDAEIRSSLSTVNIPNENQKNYKLLNSINSFPDIYRSSSGIPVKPQSESILLFSDNREPALIIMNTATNKSAAMLFYGFYKWRLNPNSTNSDDVLNSIISGTALSITDKEKRDKFFIETNKQIYSINENIIFDASINESGLKGNEKIRVRVYNDSYSDEFELDKGENFTFSGKTKIQTAGEYFYAADLISEGVVIDKITNKFITGLSSKEYKETRSDAGIFNQLASLNGGKRLNELEGSNIKDIISKSGENLSERKEFSLKEYFNTNAYYLVIIVVLLSLEWILRKRNNLP